MIYDIIGYYLIAAKYVSTGQHTSGGTLRCLHFPPENKDKKPQKWKNRDLLATYE